MASSLPPPISALPPEILHQILTYLSVPTLLIFARTSRQHYSAASRALQTLQIAILPRRIHGLLAFLNSSLLEETDVLYGEPDYDVPTPNQIVVSCPLPVPLIGSKASKPKNPTEPPPTPAQHREQLFRLQDALACSILTTSSLVHLRSLTLHIYTITSPSLPEILATCFPDLRHLHLNFSHPYLHDACLPAHYWTSSEYLRASPIWDALAGIGDELESSVKLINLERLTVERAGITRTQLQKWVERNPRLQSLTLRNVAGVDASFVKWLGGVSRVSSRSVMLKSLALEHCSSLTLGTVEDFTWLDSLFDIDDAQTPTHQDPDATSALLVLSLQGSNGVSMPPLFTYLETRRPALLQITLPDGRRLTAWASPTFSRPSPSCSNTGQQHQALEGLTDMAGNGPDRNVDIHSSHAHGYRRVGRRIAGFLPLYDNTGEYTTYLRPQVQTAGDYRARYEMTQLKSQFGPMQAEL
ncbi:hypothetical protein A1O3_06374 [Capronia epimyces CBS 606.96]|uniref:F-box domain-containing protein n=1 Tax=Capronia epimyces CBS 606.96 TaxID=1182542 RepID=W9Y004_9EURO|nr:uncharacterized protein A1O3_06374 [Capronia epimyces CBS 606.96]EXJ82561.1 hypothetical protein A1O3_06374 [Capronia epimyces CBS 606.96]